MKIPFTNIQLSPKQAVAAVSTMVGTLWASFSLLFGSAPVSAVSVIATTAVTTAITNATGFVGYAGYVNKDRAASAVTSLYHATANRLTAASAAYTPDAATKAEAESFVPRRSSRLAAKNS